MSRLSKQDVSEIIDLLENELDSIRKLDRIEKMKMRSKIRKQTNWLISFGNPASEKIFKKLEDKLPDVFSLYPFGFSDTLKKLLKVKVANMQKKAT
jgi:hypothetical protein